MNKTQATIISCLSILIGACGQPQEQPVETESLTKSTSLVDSGKKEVSKKISATSKEDFDGETVVKAGGGNEEDSQEASVPTTKPADQNSDSSTENNTSSENSCVGYVGFLHDKRWDVVYGNLTKELQEDVDSIFSSADLQFPNSIMTRPESNQPMVDSDNCGEVTTLLAPVTADQKGRIVPNQCIGFLTNPNPKNWHCEELGAQGKDFNQTNCHLGDEYKNAMACAPKDTSGIKYEMDEVECMGQEYADQNEVASSIKRQLSFFQVSEGVGVVECTPDHRSKCNDLLAADPTKAKKWVSCYEVEQNNDGHECRGFKEKLSEMSSCQEDVQSHNRDQDESCGKRLLCHRVGK